MSAPLADHKCALFAPARITDFRLRRCSPAPAVQCEAHGEGDFRRAFCAIRPVPQPTGGRTNRLGLAAACATVPPTRRPSCGAHRQLNCIADSQSCDHPPGSLQPRFCCWRRPWRRRRCLRSPRPTTLSCSSAVSEWCFKRRMATYTLVSMPRCVARACGGSPACSQTLAIVFL